MTADSEHRPLVSHDLLAKSAHCLRSSIEVGVKIWLKRFLVKRGQISFESERSAISIAGAARRGFLGTNAGED